MAVHQPVRPSVVTNTWNVLWNDAVGVVRIGIIGYHTRQQKAYDFSSSQHKYDSQSFITTDDVEFFHSFVDLNCKSLVVMIVDKKIVLICVEHKIFR